jgi:uncharacterized paraquat-inducible protein A
MNMKMNTMALGLLSCVLAFTPARAKTETVHHHGQTATTKNQQSQQKVYSCPMHPEVTAKSKGRCPKCGMDLRAVEQKEASADDSVRVARSDVPAC